MKQTMIFTAIAAALALQSPMVNAEMLDVGGASATGEYNKTLIPAFGAQLAKQGSKYTINYLL